MAEESSTAAPERQLDVMITRLRKVRSLPPEGFSGSPAVLERVREFEKQNTPALPPPSMAAAKADDFERLALLDGLTELYNYKTFLKELKAELNRAKRYKHSVCLCLISIDDYDSIAQQFGQLTGDSVLKVAAGVLRGLVRDMDICARYSDKHFAVVLPQTQASGAALVAERIRQRMGNQVIAHNTQSFSVTVSIGLAAYPANAREYDELISRAVEAMEFGIERGGDRVFSV